MSEQIWEVGCFAKEIAERTKGGRSLSNLYTIMLPPVDKSKGRAVDNFTEDVRKEETRVSQRDPNMHIIDKDHPVINITRPEGREKTGPGRFGLGVKRRKEVASFKEL